MAWAGLCPTQNESAGKRKRSRLRKGDCWLKTTMVQCAVNAAKNKDSYYKAQFSHLCAKHGAKKAFCAVAASLLTAICHILKDGVEHKDLGASYFDKRSTNFKAKRSVAQLAKLGYQVELPPLAEAAWCKPAAPNALHKPLNQLTARSWFPPRPGGLSASVSSTPPSRSLNIVRGAPSRLTTATALDLGS